MRNKKRLVSFLLIFVMTVLVGMPVNAMTFYESDWTYHKEGYIFVGESHVYLSAAVMNSCADADGYIEGLEDVRYFYRNDNSVSQDQYGNPNTMFMKGNLFFVYEGLNIPSERNTQLSKDYIYSDGKGTRGRGVEKIHEIINSNLNIAHWNIISYQGALEAHNRSSAVCGDYVASYQNWITYEFPEADCYFLSISTMTGWYDRVKDADAINHALAEAFPDQYLDYTDFLSARYPQGMRDPTLKADNIHWNDETNIALIMDVIQKLQGLSMEKQEVLLENENS